MVRGRLQWPLESYNALDPLQTGFTSHLGTQDSLLLIHRDILAKVSSCDPRIAVTINVQNTFVSVPHKVVTVGAKQRILTVRELSFIKSFLQDRYYKLRVGTTLGPKTPNNVGVPKDSMFPPTLFYVVMADLPPLLKRIEGLGYKIFVNDITFSTRGQVGIFQDGLGVVTKFL